MPFQLLLVVIRKKQMAARERARRARVTNDGQADPQNKRSDARCKIGILKDATRAAAERHRQQLGRDDIYITFTVLFSHYRYVYDNFLHDIDIYRIVMY